MDFAVVTQPVQEPRRRLGRRFSPTNNQLLNPDSLDAMLTESYTTTIESTAIGALRLVLFLFCRKYLLRSLSHDLQDISAGTSASEHPAGLDDVELSALPVPVTATSATAGHAAASTSASELTRRRQLLWARSAFALCFTECCTLFVLLMCQSAGVLGARTRLINWRFSLSILLILNVVVIPLLLSLALTYRRATAVARSLEKKSFVVRSVLTIVPVAITLFLLSRIPVPTELSDADYMTTLIARLAVAGIVVLGALSGLGAANNAWEFLPISRKEQSPDPTTSDIETAERSLARIRDDLAARQAEVAKREAAKSPQAESSWFARVVPSFRGDANQTAALQEITGLEALEYQMTRNIETMRHRRADAAFRATFFGTLTIWIGRAFAFYCIFRVFNSLINVFIPLRTTSSTSSPDAVTTLLASVIALIPSVHLEPTEIIATARQLSLILVGAIILSSVRMLLRGVARLLRITGRNQGAALMLLMLAQLMFIYLLSTLIQMRASFPSPTAVGDVGKTNLFETLPEFQVFGSLFDWTFVIFACVGGLVRWLDERVNE